MKQKKTVMLILRKILIRILFYISIIATTLTALYMAVLLGSIEQRFAGRLWDIPSKVYSDTTLLYTGQRLNLQLFSEKMQRLGYRRVSHPPEHPGEIRFSKTAIELYLHTFHAPSYKQKSAPVWIGLKENSISAIISGRTGTKTPVLEIEPEELMLYFGPDRERRQLVSIGQLPKHVAHAVLSAEDHRFHQHHGVEIRSILRALVTNLRKGTISQGGSTITQQLAKNYFLTPERTFIRKFKELLITGILEYKFDKETLLEMYLNEIYFGQEGSVSINGIGQAAWFFFDKPATELSISEAAAIAGLIKAPNRFSPHRHPDRCRQRRNEVLDAMHKWGWLDATSLSAEKNQPVAAAGYRKYRQQAPYFTDYLTKQLTTLYSHDALSSEGLAIFTTIDTQVQAAAEKALVNGLARLESANPALKRKKPDEKLQGAIIVLQPKTGYILAMVGGRDYSGSQFNRAVQADRQPGSTFKPFVYVSGLDKHPPHFSLSNTPRTFRVAGRQWTPKNYNAKAPGLTTLREAIAQSHNVATVTLAFDIGLEKIAETAEMFQLPIPRPLYPSMALGAVEVDPLSLARAYCVFAADGVLPYPLSVKLVVNTSGEVLENRHAEIKRVISPAKAYLMSDLLRGVVLNGTARALKQLGVNWPVAGKTGTTNDTKDAWFVGYTPNLLALVWVGFDNGTPLSVTGAGAALPIWADLMIALPQYVSGQWFSVPPGIVTKRICVDSGELANAACCPRWVDEVFIAEQSPTSPCRLHPCSSGLKKFWDDIKNIVPDF